MPLTGRADLTASPGGPAGHRADRRPVRPASAVDSRAVEPGMLYVAVRGSQADGHRFIPDAVRRGAAAVVVEQSAARRAFPRSWCATAGVPRSRSARRGTDTPAAGSLCSASPARTARRPRRASSATSSTRRARAGSIGTLGAFDGRGDPVESTAGSLTTPGPDRSAGDARRAGRARHDARGDGGLVAQPRPGAARRPGVRGRRSSPTSPATISTITARWRRTSPPSSS